MAASARGTGPGASDGDAGIGLPCAMTEDEMKASSLRQTTWHGMRALALESARLRAVVVPEMGAKIVSLFDKSNGAEWLVGPGQRPFRSPAYGASFVDQDMSGWDEMFPTIVSCPYPGAGHRHGVDLPDHGEVWTLPWSIEEGAGNEIALRVEGKALPYRLGRTLSLAAEDTLQLDYALENRGQEQMPYMWAAHPQFDCGQGATIVLPREVRRVCNTLPAAWGWGPPEETYDWPAAKDVRGNEERLDEVGPPSLKQARKFFALPEARPTWAAVVRKATGDWVRMAWSALTVPYFGIWVDEGALSDCSVATPEPTTGFYDSLALAWEKRQVCTIEAGATQSWTLKVQLGTGGQPLPAQD